MSKNLYDILDVDINANDEEIKKSYRKKAKQYHPDSESGDRDKFEEIKTASTILLDPNKRKKYDETGNIDDSPDTEHSEAITIIMQLLNKIVDGQSPEKIDIIKYIKESFVALKEDGEKYIDGLNKKIVKYKNLEKRFLKKNKGANIFALSMQTNIKNLNEKIAATKQKMKMLDIALAIVEDYTFEVDKTENDSESQIFKNLEDLIRSQLRK